MGIVIILNTSNGRVRIKINKFEVENYRRGFSVPARLQLIDVEKGTGKRK